MFKQRGGDIESDAEVVYGIWDRLYNYEEMLNSMWLDETFPYIGTYFGGVSDGGFGTPIYGVKLKLSEETGLLSGLTDEKRQSVNKLYSILLKHHQRHGSRQLPKVGYYAVINDINGYLDNHYKPDADIINDVMSNNNSNVMSNNNSDEDPIAPIEGGHRKANRKTRRKRKTRN